MGSTTKISVTIDNDALAWIRKRARRRGGNLSAVVTELARVARQMEARDEVIKLFGKAAHLTPARLREIEAEWGG